MRIGFIGLGMMGGPMARHLLAAGHSVTVNDLRRELAQSHLDAGARWADSGADVARQSEVIFTSLPGPKEVEAVVLGEGGLLHGFAPGALYIDLSTNSPTLLRRLHTILHERNVAMLDAPVSGGPVGAKAAKLAIYVGGDEATYERVRPLLGVLGDKVMYVGQIGAGTVAKLVHNMISICTMKVFAEAFTMGVKAGVPAPMLAKAVEAGAFGQGRGGLRMLPIILAERNLDDVSFALGLARKDLGLATEVAREFNVPMAAANLVEQDMIELMRRGLAAKDRYALLALQEERSGVKLSS